MVELIGVLVALIVALLLWRVVDKRMKNEEKNQSLYMKMGGGKRNGRV